jgi:D-arabinose 1-dehydrogenase-like Zn-dependent alcohol dehydrogenase
LPMIVMRQVRLQGVTLGSGADFADMLRACEAAQLRPVIDGKRYVFGEAPAAIASLETGKHFGKVVIEID